jgi:hypothetical protein
MKPQSSPLFSLLIVVSLLQTACVGTYDEQPHDTVNTQQALTTVNALSSNGLSANGLSANGLSANGLSANGLSANSAAMSALRSPLQGPAAQEFLRYVVSCALGPAATFSLNINGTNVAFTGELNLAPEWGGAGGFCDSRCQELVSACVMARVNFLGHHIQLSLRGSPALSPALTSTTSERSDYPKEEATYFGNLFLSTPQRLACTSPSHPNLIDRVCGSGLSNHQSCIIRILGACDSTPGGLGNPKICDYQDPVAGYREGCKDGIRRPYRAITVYRANSDEDNPGGLN